MTHRLWLPITLIGASLGCSNLTSTQTVTACPEGGSRCAPEDLGAAEEIEPSDTFDLGEVLPEDTAPTFVDEDEDEDNEDEEDSGGTNPGTSPGGSTGAVFTANFETCPGGWTLQSPWECGTPLSGPLTAPEGFGVLATRLAGDYPRGEDWFNGTATSPAFTVPATGATLSFQAWWRFEFVGSGAWADGWLVAVIPTATPGSGTILTTDIPHTANLGWPRALPAWSRAQTSWVTMTADLSPWAGQEVQLVFDMFSESTSWPEPGAYIDNIRVE